MEDIDIILASKSPRRKELLKIIVPEFKIMVSDVEEELKEGLSVQEQVTNLACIKAKDIYNKTNGDRIIIGSDTIVTKNSKIYGKPKDKEHAKNMLKELLVEDRKHSVITGLCIIIQIDGEYREFKTYDETILYLKEMTENEIEKWINTGKAIDKAGAYGIQDEFCVFVERIEGNYHTVVGLPTQKVYEILKNYIF